MIHWPFQVSGLLLNGAGQRRRTPGCLGFPGTPQGPPGEKGDFSMGIAPENG